MAESKAKTIKYKTTHNGVFIAGGIEFKPGEEVELTTEQVKSVQKQIDKGFLVKA